MDTNEVLVNQIHFICIHNFCNLELINLNSIYV